MNNNNIIEKILFNVNIDGRWYNRVRVEINANNGYTREDISTKEGYTFFSHVGRDNFDVRVYTNQNGEYAVKLTLMERNDNGEWVKSKEKKKIRVNNVKVKFCGRIY